MKQFLLLAAMSMLFSIAKSQNNYTGSYGYTMKPSGETPAGEKASGPSGSLVLVKMEGNKYRFWLDVNKGWPSYNSGSSDGTITFKNDTASFDNTFEGARHPCVMHFRISKNTIYITGASDASDCGFGNGVSADGEYAKWKVQPKLNNTWLGEEYSQSPKMVITANKAALYKDENAMQPAGQSFLKGDIFLSIAETEKTVYTEKFNSAGKFVYGWIKKSDLKLMEGD